MKVIETLVGHGGPIIAIESTTTQLCSTGEDKKFIIWDLDSSKQITAISADEEISCIKYTPTDSNILYYAQHNHIYSYDQRSNTHISIYTTLEEISSIDVHINNRFLGFIDDSGCPTVLDIRNTRPFKKITRKHSNIGSIFKFRPRTPWQAITGGFDCTLRTWDFSRARCIDTYEFQSKVCNPPFVISLDTSLDGHCVVAGLGDGSINVFNNISRKFELESSMAKNLSFHTWNVSALSFVDLDGTDDGIISTGIDSRIGLWNLDNMNLVDCLERDYKINCLSVMRLRKYAVGGTFDGYRYPIEIISY